MNAATVILGRVEFLLWIPDSGKRNFDFKKKGSN